MIRHLGLVILTVLCVAVTALAFGGVLSSLWVWFISPLGVPPITWLHGAGLSLLADLWQSSTRIDLSMLARQRTRGADKLSPAQEMVARCAATVVVYYPLLWVAGYIVSEWR